MTVAEYLVCGVEVLLIGLFVLLIGLILWPMFMDCLNKLTEG